MGRNHLPNRGFGVCVSALKPSPDAGAIRFLNESQQLIRPASRLPLAHTLIRATDPPIAPAGRGKELVGIVEHVRGNPQLLEVVLALTPPGRLPGSLNGGKQ